MTVTIIVVLELILCAGWISQSNAQASASLFPQEHQSVCRGETISYICIGNGTDMILFSPPIVNRTEAFVLVRSTPEQMCNVIRDSSLTNVFVDFGGSSSFTATLTLFISDELSEGQLSVHCNVLAGLVATMTSANFSVLDAPTLETVNNISLLPVMVPLGSSDDIAQAAVNISWDSPVIAEEFILTISNSTNSSIRAIRSLEKRATVTVLLPFGMYSARLCVVHQCEKDLICQTSTTKVPVERPPMTECPASQQETGADVDSALLAAAVIAGVMGVLFIFAAIYGIFITIKWYKIKIKMERNSAKHS